MKAILICQHGGLDQINFQEIDCQEVRAGYVLVKMKAAALNHLDLFVTEGIPGLKLEMPHVLGADGAGVVEVLGEDVAGFAVGDRVMLNAALSCEECEFCRKGEHGMCIRLQLVGEHSHGTFAEYFSVPAVNLEKIPPSVSFEEAAAFSLVFQTAWRMLKTRSAIQSGDTVFIHGIGGGVGSAALHIVKLLGGCAFVSSSSDAKLMQAKAMGADYCYNCEQPDVVREVLRETAKRGVDVVVDNVGEATWLQSLQMVRRGGKIVTCGATTGPNPKTEIRAIFWKQIDILGSTMGNRSEYSELVQLLGQGRLKPIVDRVFPLAEGKQAMEYLKCQKQFGKVLLIS